MQQSVQNTTSAERAGLTGFIRRISDMWRELREAQARAAEFAALNALSDVELARMGLTRSVLKRHLHQKYAGRELLSEQAGWYDPDLHPQSHDDAR